MGKIADIIYRHFGCESYSDEKQAEKEIIKLIKRKVIIHPKKTISKTGDSALNYYNEIKQNLAKLKED